jgi:hypothetical protein
VLNIRPIFCIRLRIIVELSQTGIDSIAGSIRVRRRTAEQDRSHQLPGSQVDFESVSSAQAAARKVFEYPHPADIGHANNQIQQLYRNQC